MFPFLLVACAKPAADSNPTTGTTSGGTSGGETVVVTGDISISCAPQADNALRFDCEFTPTTPGSLDLSWTDGGTTRSETIDQTTSTIWGMKPETTYTLTVSGVDGSAEIELTTGSLPADLAGVIATTEGTLSFDQLLVELPCGDLPTTAMLDTDGEVVWYQQYPDPNWTGLSIPYQGFQFTNDRTVLLSLGMNHVYEHTLGGQEVLHLERGVDWPDVPIHHDIFKAPDGKLYTLYGYVDTPYVATYLMDGMYVWDGDVLVGDWRTTDSYPVTDGWGAGVGVFWEHEFPGVSEYTHANSIAVDEQGVAVISLKSQESVIALDGNPDSPGFGDLLWTLAGNPDAHPYDGDFAFDGDFYAQHHASWWGPNQIGVFDNRSGVGTSRGLVIDLDPTAGTASIAETWDTSTDCPAQGAIYPVSNGNRLVTCGPQQLVYEFAPGSATPHFTMDVTCGGASVMLPRAIPVE